MAKFSRQHYNILASVFNKSLEAADPDEVRGIVRTWLNLVERLQTDNELFDSKRFLEASFPLDLKKQIVLDLMNEGLITL